MSSISDWCAAHLAKPGIADPYLDRALDGIRRIEALADELRAERNRQEAHEQRMEVLITQMRVETARAHSLFKQLNMAVGALESVLQAQLGPNGRKFSRDRDQAPARREAALAPGEIACEQGGGSPPLRHLHRLRIRGGRSRPC